MPWIGYFHRAAQAVGRSAIIDATTAKTAPM